VVPDLSHVGACSIECRWEDWFVALVDDIAATLDRDSWVLDTNGVLWAARDIDPTRLRL
jgi:hypothetical protein